jgi:hypothetical protein
MKISDDVREIAISQLEAVVPSYPDVDQTTELLRGILTGPGGTARVAAILRTYASDSEISRLGQILPRVSEDLGEELDPVVDAVLEFASSVQPTESQALDIAIHVAHVLGTDQVQRTVELTVDALVAGGERSVAARNVVMSPSSGEFLKKHGSTLDDKLLAELSRRGPDQATFEAAKYLVWRFRGVDKRKQTTLRKMLTGWLDSDPDWGAEVGVVGREMELTASQRLPLVRALLRAAEKASESSLRAEALREANGLASDSKPARKLVTETVTRMLRSGDQASAEAVAIAGVSSAE